MFPQTGTLRFHSHILLSLKVTQQGPYGDSCPVPDPSFTYLLQSPLKRSPNKTKSHLSLKVTGKSLPLYVSSSGAL